MTHARIAKKTGALPLDVDLTLEGVTALVGPAGAGKSLLLECIAGFVRPDAGRILLDNAILFDAETGVDVPPRRRAIAWIGPEDALFPHMTVEQNVKFGAARLPRLERHRRTAEMMERWRLTALAKARPAALTPMESLRGAVARALIGGPKLLLLDERVWDEALVREISAAATVPVLIVTGDLDLCCAAAAKLVILEAGRIVQRGAPRAVLDAPESVEAARALGIANIFEGTIAALDPTRDTSRIELPAFALNAPYIPGHFRGDRICIAIDAHDVRVHAGEVAPPINGIPGQLVRAVEQAHTVRLEFAGPVIAEVGREEYLRQRDNKSWHLEFPPAAIKVL